MCTFDVAGFVWRYSKMKRSSGKSKTKMNKFAIFFGVVGHRIAMHHRFENEVFDCGTSAR